MKYEMKEVYTNNVNIVTYVSNFHVTILPHHNIIFKILFTCDNIYVKYLYIINTQLLKSM